MSTGINFTPNNSLPIPNAANTVEILTPDVLKQGDTFNEIRVRLKRNNVNVNFANVTVVWSAAGAKGTIITDRPATIHENGEMSFSFTEEDKGAWGTLRIEFKVTHNATNKVEMFPANDHVRLHVTRSHDDLSHTPVMFASLSYFNAQVEAAAKSALEASQRALLVEGQGELAQVAAAKAESAAQEAETMAYAAENAAQEADSAKQQVIEAAADAKTETDYIKGKRPLIEQSISDAAESKTQSANAVVVSGAAKTTAETVRDEFNQVIAEAGSNNPEVVQARGGEVNLNKRLDVFTSQLADTANQIPDIVVNANLFPDLQTAIDYCIANKRKLNIPGGTYDLTKGLIVDGNLEIIGNVKNVVLSFSGMTSGTALTIGVVNGLNGFMMDGIRFVGNPNITCLHLNGTLNISKAITDSNFKNLRIENFGLGLKGGYSWCNLFENVRFQACRKPIEASSQFNNNEFNRVTLSAMQEASTFSNCEGINFTSPNIVNIPVGQYAFTLYQTEITITNPYYEHVYGRLAFVGTTSEVIPSAFTSIGGRGVDKIIRIALKGDRATLCLKNLSNNSKFVVDDGNESVTPYKYSHRIEMDSNDMYENNYLVKWDGTTPVPFANSYGGITLTSAIHPDKYTKVTTGAGSTGGLQIGNLTIGEDYVFVYSLQKQPGSNVTIRLGTLASSPLRVEEHSTNFEVRYVPFTAKDEIFRLLWSPNTTLHVSFLGIVKGSKFPQIPKSKGNMYSPNLPVSETWKVGDRVYNSNPIAGGFEGWVCVSAGTPGVWKGFGLIEV